VGFDAVLVVSFGGPEGPEDVMPFLRNVVRGRPVPDARLQQVAAHYQEFGGISPINGQNRALVSALGPALAERHAALPVYWGNRNWHPYLDDVVATMAADGIRRAAAFVTSAYSSYSSCRQYLEDLDRARRAVGANAPEIVKLRPYFNHPGLVVPLAEGLRAARLDAGPDAPVLMSAHSIPVSMAEVCAYERQLRETADLVATAAGVPEDRWTLAFQSRSGSPQQPWLGPDVNDCICALDGPPPTVIVVPVGFVSDHMEVVYDLDRAAGATAAGRGIRLVRTRTPGSDPRFVSMICDLVEEVDGRRPPVALGDIGPMGCPCSRGCPSGRPEAG
jgi:protoporphyrin/coproporphyrin ferrochelatase